MKITNLIKKKIFTFIFTPYFTNINLFNSFEKIVNNKTEIPWKIDSKKKSLSIIYYLIENKNPYNSLILSLSVLKSLLIRLAKESSLWVIGNENILKIGELLRKYKKINKTQISYLNFFNSIEKIVYNKTEIPWKIDSNVVMSINVLIHNFIENIQ